MATPPRRSRSTVDPSYPRAMGSSARRAQSSTAAMLASCGIFQACLACGAPWGRAAYGGQHPGRLPGTYRGISAVAGPAYGAAAALTASGTGSPRVRSRGFTALTGFMVVGVAANLASRSRLERLIWTPVCAVTAWLARGG